MRQVTCDRWHMKGDMWHLTLSVGWTFSQNSSSIALPVWVWQCLEYIWNSAVFSWKSVFVLVFLSKIILMPIICTHFLRCGQFYPHYTTNHFRHLYLLWQDEVKNQLCFPSSWYPQKGNPLGYPRYLHVICLKFFLTKNKFLTRIPLACQTCNRFDPVVTKNRYNLA